MGIQRVLSCVSEQSEGPPVEHSLEARAGGAPSDAPLTASQVSPIRDSAVMLPIDESALVTDCPKLSPGYREDIAIDAR